jgi:hypothetical protein
MTPDQLARLLGEFLAEAPAAVVLEDGVELFDLARARYSVTGEHGACLIHIWSDERNVVRRVHEAEHSKDVLRLEVHRFGQTKYTTLEICRQRDRRTPSQKRSARSSYARLLPAVLERAFPGWKLQELSTASDLTRSFGPIYARGLQRRGQSAFAILGVNPQEDQASIDAALTIGLLWLQHCRERDVHLLVEGLRLVVPAGTSSVVRERMAHLDRDAARFELYELADRSRDLLEIDAADRGNMATRLVRATHDAAVRERFAASIFRVSGTCERADVAVLSPTEISFRLCGLEFARASLVQESGSFRNTEQLTFGFGASASVVTKETAADFRRFLKNLDRARRAHGRRSDPLFRMHPERWLESLVVKDVSGLDGRLDTTHVYSQVPAFSAADRAMIDVLCATRDSRLAVLELKADEDIHLPLQAVDYWARVRWHHSRREFQKFGYFPGRELSPASPLLLMVCPSLRIHPATDTLLRYISPEIEYELLGIDEHWREHLRVVFRKRRQDRLAASARR